MYIVLYIKIYKCSRSVRRKDFSVTHIIYKHKNKMLLTHKAIFNFDSDFLLSFIKFSFLPELSVYL